jgi:transcriptional regulator GlxA family with amidase domain
VPGNDPPWVVRLVGRKTLLRRFRAETGQTPLEYLQATRVRRVCQLLEPTDLAISAVAEA